MEPMYLANPAQAFRNGLSETFTLGRQVQDQGRRNALIEMYQENGPGIMQGDQNALAALSRLDPQAALGVRDTLSGIGAREAGTEIARGNLDMRRQEFRETRERSRQETLRLLQENQAEIDAAALEAETDRIVAQINGLNTPDLWNSTGREVLGEEWKPWEQRGLVLADLAGDADAVSDFLSSTQAPGPQSSAGQVQADINAGLLPEGTPLRGSGVTVNTGDMGPNIGTVPQGYSVVADPNDPSGFRMVAIPGGPEDASGDQENAAAKAADSIALIDNVLNDPALSQVTGMIEGRLPGRNQAQTDLNVRIEQLKGQAFLQAFETLKGGGQITEREGIAAQNAIARLDQSQSDEAYRAALTDLRNIMARAYERATGGSPAPDVQRGASGFSPAQGGQGSQPAPSDTAPQQGQTQSRANPEASPQIATRGEAIAFVNALGAEGVAALPAEERQRLQSLIGGN
jgi:hypothetical protein